MVERIPEEETAGPAVIQGSEPTTGSQSSE